MIVLLLYIFLFLRTSLANLRHQNKYLGACVTDHEAPEWIRSPRLRLCSRISLAITRNVTLLTSPRSPHLHAVSLSVLVSQCRRSSMTWSVLSVLYHSSIIISMIRVPSCSLVVRIRIMMMISGYLMNKNVLLSDIGTSALRVNTFLSHPRNKCEE